jgi:hypothetical protein
VLIAALLLGALLSSIGGTASHGLAALSAAEHTAAALADEAHGHVHEDGEDDIAAGGPDLSTGHFHHGHDHSHDNAHAPPGVQASAATWPARWRPADRAWVEHVVPFRLDRPPMARRHA